MADTRQINIANAKASDTLAFAVALLCCIFSIFLVYERPGDSGLDSIVSGGVSDFSAIFGMLFFGLYCMYFASKLIKFGAVVSVGKRGIFDKRLSTDWIPWQAISNVRIIDRDRQQGLIVRLNQSHNTVLPLRSGVSNIIRMSAAGAPLELRVMADNLKGGFGTLFRAVTRFHRIHDDAWDE